MTLPASLRAVLDALEQVSDDVYAFVNRRTGEVTTAFRDDLAAAEDGERGLGFDTVEGVEEAERILADPDWVRLPSAFDMHEWDMLRRFAALQEAPEHRARLAEAIRGRGAFRRFKDAAARLGLLDAWYAFREECLAELAIGWLEADGVPFVDDRGARV